MSYPRVNLLKKSEQRHQGAISRRFVTMSAVVTPILAIAVVSAVKLIQYTGVQSDLKASRVFWADLEPQLKQFTKENQGLGLNRRAMELFDGWQASQGSFVQLLNDVQDSVPENIQFKRLSIRTAAAPSVFDDAADMELSYGLVIEGVAAGGRAESNVITLRRDLLACEQIGSTFDSMKLAALRKKQTSEGDPIQEFRLEGATAQEEL